MSVITLADAKAFLDVIHSADDDKLQGLLDGAEQEALDFMDRTDFDSLCPECSEVDSDAHSEASEYLSEITAQYGMPASVRTGILWLFQAAYQATPVDAEKLRTSAERLLFPHRCNLGV